MSERFINPSKSPPAAPPTAPPAAAPGDSASAAASDERVSMLSADRACTRCAFNLLGQPVVRERHYGLLIIRCPECGTVASLQEYPLLGRWANRWGALLAGLWFLLITAATLSVAGIIAGFTLGTTLQTSDRLVNAIKDAYIAHEAALGKAADQVSWWWITDMNWWNAQDKSKFIADAGGWMRAVRWRGFALWIMGGCILFPIAAAWSVMMAHRRGLRLVLTLLPMLGFALVFNLFSRFGVSTFTSVQDLAASLVWNVVMPLSLLCASVSLFAGVLLGRPLARLVVRAAMPPRLRVPLSWLWTCDGLPPPRTS